MADRPVVAAAWLKPDYRASLEAAGARIRELSPSDPLPQALEGCSGLMLTGGADVDPIEYGETERHPTVELDLERDRYELALAREALKRDLPVLAICRGAQVLNTAAGGTLIQDIPSARPGALDHQQPDSRDSRAHDVTVAPDTCLWTLMAPQLDRTRTLAVNSRHHQSVDKPAPGFIVSAVSPDGIVEAIEKPDAQFCVGVQWHPENFRTHGEFNTLFQGFVEAATKYRRRPR